GGRDERGGGGRGLLAGKEAELHLGQVAARPRRPLPLQRELFDLVGQLRGFRGVRSQGGGELPGGLVEALVGRSPPLRGLPRFGVRLRQLAHAQAAQRQAEVVERRGVLGKI